MDLRGNTFKRTIYPKTASMFDNVSCFRYRAIYSFYPKFPHPITMTQMRKVICEKFEGGLNFSSNWQKMRESLQVSFSCHETALLLKRISSMQLSVFHIPKEVIFLMCPFCMLFTLYPLRGDSKRAFY